MLSSIFIACECECLLCRQILVLLGHKSYLRVRQGSYALTSM